MYTYTITPWMPTGTAALPWWHYFNVTFGCEVPSYLFSNQQ